MKKLLGIFKQKWFLTLIGIIAISLIVFFLGDVLRIGSFRPFSSIQSRYIAIGSLTAGWFFYHLWRWFRTRKNNQQMMDNLVDSAEISSDEADSEEEIQTLSENLQDALNTIKSVQKKDGTKQNLYQLPWYVIIGPPGAGKTTLLANSQLHFPLSDKYGKDAIRGVGGTRNCDWWFTDEAILLDTAGRYTTQDSRESVDQAAWKGFLELLRKSRTKQPINGVILAVSLSDILQFSEEEVEQHALTIRKRVQELYKHLGIKFPVYMVFTKCDLLSGFTEFYDELNAEERSQVWGMTFPYDDNSENSAVEAFGVEFTLLEERIYQQLLDKLDKERSLECRQTLYLFPQQFSALKDVLHGFLESVYQSSRFHDTMMLRGVYFTSATQEGTPIDRIMSSLVRNYGVAPQQLSRFSDKGKSFFINSLLEQVIFTESGLASTNVKLSRKLRWLRTSLAALALLTAVGFSAIFITKYIENNNFIADYSLKINEIDRETASIPEASQSIESHLEVLERVRQLSFSYADHPPEVSFMSSFGLDQERAIKKKTDTKYEDLLLKIIRPYTKSVLEQNIQSNLSTKPESIFGALKAYLFLAGKAPEDESIQVQGIDWNNDGNMDDIYDQKVSLHLSNLLSKPKNYIEANDALVVRARAALLGIDVTQLIYQKYKHNTLSKASKYDFNVLQKDRLDQIDRSFIRKSKAAWSVGIPGLYTKEGYEKVFLPGLTNVAKEITKDAWILGSGLRLGDLSNAEELIFGHYQQDYIALWTGFLDDIQAKNISDRTQAQSVFLALTENGGNLLFRLIQEVKNETYFQDDKEKEQSQENTTRELIKTRVPERVEQHFLRFTDWDEENEFKVISGLFGEIHQAFSQDTTFDNAQNNSLKNALDKLSGEADKLPVLMRNMIKSLTLPSKNMVEVVLKDKATEQFKDVLKEKVGDFCTQKIVKYYPIKKNVKKAISLADFTNFFQLGGILDSFEKQHLEDASLSAELKNKVRGAFAKARNIREIFFSTGSLRVDFGLELVTTHPNIASVELMIGSSSQIFEVGTITRRMFSWPSSERISVLIGVKDSPGSRFEEQIYQGDAWGVFRLIKKDQLVLRKFSGTKLIVFPAKNSPFKLAERALRGFKCPTL